MAFLQGIEKFDKGSLNGVNTLVTRTDGTCYEEKRSSDGAFLAATTSTRLAVRVAGTYVLMRVLFVASP
jgi:hypothetical protein